MIEEVDEGQAVSKNDDLESIESDDDPFQRIANVEKDFPVDQISDAGSLHLEHQEGQVPEDSALNIALRRLGLHEEVERAEMEHQENPNDGT